MIPPASMKNGMAMREKESQAVNIFCAMVMPLADGVSTKNGITETPIAIAIGQPRIRNAKKIIRINASIYFSNLSSFFLKWSLYISIIWYRNIRNSVAAQMGCAM